MNDFINEIDRELRDDRRRALWQRYGKFVIAGALAIVLIVAGRQGYIAWRDGVRADAADAYTAALTAADAGDTAALAALAGEGGEGYPMLAAFNHAARLAEAGDGNGASAAYRALAGDSSLAQPYRDAAAVLAVMHADSAEAVYAATQLLLPIAAADSDSPWRFLALEMLIGLALEAGEQAQAREYATRLRGMPDLPEDVRQRLAVIADVIAE